MLTPGVLTYEISKVINLNSRSDCAYAKSQLECALITKKLHDIEDLYAFTSAKKSVADFLADMERLKYEKFD